MFCLLPQFKCLPHSFYINSNTHHQSSSQFYRYIHVSSFQRQRLATVATVLEKAHLEDYLKSASTNRPLSISASTATPVLDLELESHSSSAIATKPWTYSSAIGPHTEANFGAISTSETLVSKDETTIAAAAAEAVALAKTAAKVAKDVAAMVNLYKSTKPFTDADSSLFDGTRMTQLRETVQLGQLGVLEKSESDVELDDEEPTLEDLEILQEELSQSIAVRSSRQPERQAKRARAAERTSVGVVSVTSGSTSKKKRSPVQEIDYSDPLRHLRGSTSSKLLTGREERELSRGIQIHLKLEKLYDEYKERYGSEPNYMQWAAAAGIDQLTLRKNITYGKICKDKMIKSNIRLVISIAKNYQGVGMNLQDLVQEGCRGLVRGAEKFDASKGFKFSTYAHWWIKQAVRKSLSDQCRTIRLPFHMVDATYKVKEAKKQLFNENGKHPSNEEVAEATGLSMKRLEAVLLTPKTPRSLDQKFGLDYMKPSEAISDPEAKTSEELLIKQLMKEDLDKVLDTLNPRERQVVRWRFGLDDGRMKTLQEIGEIMGVSRERVRQIESCAFRKLKNKKRTKNLHQYLVSH
ncbi:RNA polymerase sigma factor sigB isoform X2 [Daucus carota subsp. sativus]|uniref:RNA polymerase sigma factor sigB isoform X2 n=1 Tax=Daucus carota subsp. sativus TaxID=79200 RepID=UPI00308318EB